MIAYLRPVLQLSLPRPDPGLVRFSISLLGWWLLGFSTTGLILWLTA